MLCTACQAEIAEPGRFCPACAAPLPPEDAETVAVARRQKPPSSSSRSADDGRFPPGSLLLDRYRVISLVGRGGVAEVYRASDLRLNQPVALKFLPEATARRPGLMLRFGILPGTLIVLISVAMVGTSPLTSDLSAWYASRGLIVVGLTLALAIWSFGHALGGRKVFKDGFLDG